MNNISSFTHLHIDVITHLRIYTFNHLSISNRLAVEPNILYHII